MLTQIDLAGATGLGITQLRKYLKWALREVSQNRDQFLAEDEVLVQEVNGKPQYNPVVLQQIQEKINNVRRTRYQRASNTRRRNRSSSREVT